MRIVLKPLGVVALLVALSSLSFLAFKQGARQDANVPAKALASPLPVAVGLPENVLYSDGLQNGWEDWSWAKKRDFAAPDAPEGSTGTVIKATILGDEAVYLSHAPFSSAPYDRVAFSVHGGKTGGQRLLVASVAGRNAHGDNKQYGEAAPMTLPANEWRKAVIPLADLRASDKPDLGGFWFRLDRAGTHDPIYLDNVRLLKPDEK